MNLWTGQHEANDINETKLHSSSEGLMHTFISWPLPHVQRWNKTCVPKVLVHRAENHSLLKCAGKGGVGKGGEKIGGNLLNQLEILKRRGYRVAGAVTPLLCVLGNEHSQSFLPGQDTGTYKCSQSLLFVSHGLYSSRIGGGRCCEKTLCLVSLCVF